MDYTTTNFQKIMQDMMNQVSEDDQIFEEDPNNPHRIILKDPRRLFNRELTDFEQQMIKVIENVDDYSWNRGKQGGFKTGFEMFDMGLEGGLQPGLCILAAQPNVGKSAFMLQMAKQVSELNDNAYCVYFTLDDSANELLPRYIACDQRITITQAKTPERFLHDPEIIEKRNNALKKLYRSVDRFGIFDSSYGTSVEKIENMIKNIMMGLPDNKRLCVFIDNFYDLTVETKNFKNEQAKYEFLSGELNRWALQYDIPVVCTGELRKLNGNRRPTVDDLRETTKIVYEAKFIGLLYNEVGIKEENASVYWIHEETEQKMPVIELRFAKNKYGSFKSTLFYEFYPAMSFCMEASPEAVKRYTSQIYQG